MISIAVVDYGMGNIGSILNMYKYLDVPGVCAVSDPDLLAQAEKIILPGVGAFDSGMASLHQRGLVPVLHAKALEEKVPILGICLGMQLMTQGSQEGVRPGLGWIDATTCRFSFPAGSALKVPHMGWEFIRARRSNELIPADGPPRFYFVHSYYVRCEREDDILAEADYGGLFACAFQRDNLVGVQFHPEKSHRFGKAFLASFAEV